LKISPDGKAGQLCGGARRRPNSHDLWLSAPKRVALIDRSQPGPSRFGNYHWAKDGSLTLYMQKGFPK